jgi:hypothetical protein
MKKIIIVLSILLIPSFAFAKVPVKHKIIKKIHKKVSFVPAQTIPAGLHFSTVPVNKVVAADVPLTATLPEVANEVNKIDIHLNNHDADINNLKQQVTSIQNQINSIPAPTLAPDNSALIDSECLQPISVIDFQVASNNKLLANNLEEIKGRGGLDDSGRETLTKIAYSLRDPLDLVLQNKKNSIILNCTSKYGNLFHNPLIPIVTNIR